MKLRSDISDYLTAHREGSATMFYNIGKYVSLDAHILIESKIMNVTISPALLLSASLLEGN